MLIQIARCRATRTDCGGSATNTRYRSLVLGIRHGHGFGKSHRIHTLSCVKQRQPLPGGEPTAHPVSDRLFPSRFQRTRIAQREVEFAQRRDVLDSGPRRYGASHKRLAKSTVTSGRAPEPGIRDLEATMQEENRGLYATKPAVEPIDSASDFQSTRSRKNGLVTDVITKGCSMLSRARCKPTARRVISDMRGRTIATARVPGIREAIFTSTTR